MCFQLLTFISSQWNRFRRSSNFYQPLQESQEVHGLRQLRHSSPSSGRLRKRQRHRRKPSTPYLEIHYGQEKPFMQLIPEDQQYHTVTVNDVKVWCKDKLALPLRTMKLQYRGGFLNDDHVTLENLGIHPGSPIDVFGDRVTEEQRQAIVSGDLEEVGACQIIDKVVNEYQSLATRVTELEQQHQQTDEQRHLAQVLMQAMVTLDGVECPLQFRTARQRRRDAIRHCQDLLDQVNGSKSHDGQH